MATFNTLRVAIVADERSKFTQKVVQISTLWSLITKFEIAVTEALK